MALTFYLVVQLHSYAIEVSRWKLWFNDFTRKNYYNAVKKMSTKDSSSSNLESKAMGEAVQEVEETVQEAVRECNESSSPAPASASSSSTSSQQQLPEQEKARANKRSKKAGNVNTTGDDRATMDADLAGLVKQIGTMVRRAPAATTSAS